MNSKIKILIPLIFLITTSNAQEFHIPWRPFTTKANSLNRKLTGRKYFFNSTLKGTVYYNDNWLKGTIILENGDRHDSIYMKYNTFIEELIIFNERTGAIYILDKPVVSQFEIDKGNGSEKLFRKLYFDRFPRGDRYFNVLYPGDKLKLLLWHKTIVEKTNLYKDKNGLMRNSEFKMTLTYFILFPDIDLIKIFPNRRSFINLFPDQKKIVRRLLRRNRINLKREEDMIKAVSLMEEEFFTD
jgi:hypothetical protein